MLTTTCPPVDSIIQIDVVIPRLFSVSKKEIKSKMRVLRVDEGIEGQGRTGFSAAGKGFSLRSISKRLSEPIADLTQRLTEKN